MKKHENLNVYLSNDQGAAKYDTNKVHRKLIHKFMNCVLELVGMTGKKNIFEVGCGEGQIMGVLYQHGYHVAGMDIASEAVEITRRNFRFHEGVEADVCQGDVYDTWKAFDDGIVICCEVLEHLPEPERALGIIADRTKEYFLLSVPREPIWCILNFLRGKYWKTWGNTPGHINHWGKRKFLRLCSNYGKVIEVRTPLPWIMVLVKKE